MPTQQMLVNIILIILFTNVLSIDNPRNVSESTLDIASDAAELKYLLHEIKSQSAKKFGIFSDSLIISGVEEMKKATFNDGTEASINRKVSDDLFENDILLNIEQAHEILTEVKNEKRLLKRQAQPGLKFMWTNKKISYVFGYNDYIWQQLIKRALSHIEEQTCIRFFENGPTYDKLQFIRGSGCWSNVGRQGGRQQVSIGYGCDSLGIVAHETLHALGLWHEQSRYDRDDYIRIDWTKIFRGTQSNFEKRTPVTSDNMDMAYDLGSVMHYGSKAFSTDWSSYSIVTKNSIYQQTIGQRRGISYKDAKMINLRYCMDICKNQLKCMNGGYTDPNNCQKCRCPTGYSGTLCNRVQASSIRSCNGGELRGTGNWKILTSPYLNAGINCFWRITAPADKKIELKFEKLNFPCSDVCDSYIEVKYLSDKTITGARMCCLPPTKSIITKEVGTDVILNFYGDASVQNGYHGFLVKYRILTEDESPVEGYLENLLTTTSPQEKGEWSAWGEWSTCSRPCGGCGTRIRVRACYPEHLKCDGDFQDTESCNQHVCKTIDTKKNQRCMGRLVMPCDLMEKLDFGTTRSSDSSKENDIPYLPTNSKNLHIVNKGKKLMNKRKKRFVDGDKQMEEESICEKKFSYNCPTNLLTINVDWKKPNDNYQIGMCCSGYKPNKSNVCVLV
ncbi:Astacin-like metalloendopeptidase [Strongyloides ratti]|uniref:Metalloendopeptidase n=1 Tax=Strongyloides ratti TaxID=34506 RepID=A0A090L4D5_STRRB|nr:Astacin-like metalloendopeptidase [Strongyloides ratti]CEF62982.1 Astacin-like metalloendopeptidase [Strongyloides ratti]